MRGDLTASFTMEAAPLAQNAHVPLLTPTATNKAITPIGNFIFRSCFTDPFTGRVMARFALDHLNARRAVIMTDIKQDYSVGVAAELKQYFGANGGQLLDALADTKDVSGVTGNISLDDQRNGNNPGVIVTIQAGTIKMVEIVRP